MNTIKLSLSLTDMKPETDRYPRQLASVESPVDAITGWNVYASVIRDLMKPGIIFFPPTEEQK